MVKLLKFLEIMVRLIIVQKSGRGRIIEGEGLVLYRFVVQPEENIVPVELPAVILNDLNLVSPSLGLIGREEIGVRSHLVISILNHEIIDLHIGWHIYVFRHVHIVSVIVNRQEYVARVNHLYLFLAQSIQVTLFLGV